MCKKVQFSILILILALTGCKTTEVHKADRTVKVMNKKSVVVKSAPDRITAVTDSLNELVKEGGDMQAEFKAFDKNVMMSYVLVPRNGAQESLSGLRK